MIDRLCDRDIRWYLWLPAISLFASMPIMIDFLMWPVDGTLFSVEFPLGLAYSILGAVISAALTPALVATGQTLVNTSMRASSHARWTMASKLIGMGLGPVVVRVLSEHFAPTYGSESIRYALIALSLVPIPGGITLLMGARHIERDVASIIHNRN